MAEISVVMTVYNCDKYLKEAVDSILTQTMSDFEFIIVDDGSTDNSLNVLKDCVDPRIKIVALEENKGVANARNVALRHCTGGYVALMDADDISHPKRLELQYAFLNENPDIDAVYAKFQQMDSEGKLLNWVAPRAYYNYKYVKAYMILENTVTTCGMMFRKKIVDEYGLKFDENEKIGSDYKFWCNYIQHGRIVGMDEVLWYYRLRNHSLYNNSPLSDRQESYRKLALYNFDLYGFQLADEEKEILVKVYGVNGKISSFEEMARLYKTFIKMANQAAEKEMDCAEEVRIMCKKRFLEKIQQADELWILEN